MKLTVCFGHTKVVVPCGSGEISIRDLAFNSLKRVRHTLPKLGPHDRVVVHSVTIARDGGILDWDDLVRDVLDDRELVTAHYSIATLAVENSGSELVPPSSSSDVLPAEASSDPLFRHLCAPLVVDLRSDNGAWENIQRGPQPTEISVIGEGVGVPSVVELPASAGIGLLGNGDIIGADGLIIGDSNTSASSSSLSLNVSSGSGCIPGQVIRPSGVLPGGTDHSVCEPRISSALDAECPVIAGMQGDEHCALKRSSTNHHPNMMINGKTSTFTDQRPGPTASTDVCIHRLTDPTNCSNTLPKIWQKAFSPTPFELLPAVLSRRRDCLAMNWDSDEEDEDEANVDFDETFDSGSRFLSCDRKCTVSKQSITTVLHPLSTSIDTSKPRTCSASPSKLQTAVSQPQNSTCPIECTPTHSSSERDPVGSPDVWPLPPPPPQFDDPLTATRNNKVCTSERTDLHPGASSPSQRTSSPLSVSRASDSQFGRCALSDSLTPVLQNCLLQSTSVCVCSEINLLTNSITTNVPSYASNEAGLTPGSVYQRSPPSATLDLLSCDLPGTTGESAIGLADMDVPILNRIDQDHQSHSCTLTMSPTPLLQPVPVPPIRLNVNRFGGTFQCGSLVPTIPEVEEEEEEVEEDAGEDENEEEVIEGTESVFVKNDICSTNTMKRSPVKANCLIPASAAVHTDQPQAPRTSRSSVIVQRHAEKSHSAEEADGELEEDYPLLRPDYFVGNDRLDDGVDIVHSVEKGQPPRQPSLDQHRETDVPGSKTRLNFHVAVEESTPSVSHHRPLSARSGMDPPAVLRWLESTQDAVTVTEHDSSCSSTTNTSSDSTSLSTVSNRSTHTLHEQSVEPRDDGPRMLPGTVLVRLANTHPGENLGIQIKPVFTDRFELLSRGFQVPEGTRVESGLEVHHVMPNGRVAREGFLSVGDRILNIDGVSLIGVPFEKGRDLFQAALKNPELTLHIQRKSSRLDCDQKTDEKEKKSSIPSCRLIVVTDLSDKAKEAEASQSTQKPAPPPPPRRSPNTVLTRIPTGVIPPLIEEFLQDQDRNKGSQTLSSSKNSALPVLPPKAESKSQSPPLADCISIQLKKGSNGLGFSLTSRDLNPAQTSTSTPERVVCVKNILPGGAALMDGRLRPGDRLIQVDGLNVTKLGQANTVTLLREKPVDSIVDLLVWRPKETESSGDQATCRESLIPPTSTSHGDSDRPSKSPVRSDAKLAKSNTPKSPSHLPANQLYKLYAIDPAQYTLLQLHINLPQTSPTGKTNLIGAVNSGSGTELNTQSSAHPVTLGVSVSVRPLANQPIIAQHSEDTSNNAVFVRTVIEGGPAYVDGRLKIGDRLLTIDGEPLSGISSADALTRLKSVIARDMAESRPHVCLLIARLKFTEDTDGSSRRATISRGPSSARTASNRNEGTQSVVPATAMIVSADVHPPEGGVESSGSKNQPNISKTESKLLSKPAHGSVDSRHAHGTSALKNTVTNPARTKSTNRTRTNGQLINGLPNGSKTSMINSTRKELRLGPDVASLTSVCSIQTNNSSDGMLNATKSNNRSPSRSTLVDKPSPHLASSKVPKDRTCSLNSERIHHQAINNSASVFSDRNPSVSKHICRADSQSTISSAEMPEDEIRLSDYNTVTTADPVNLDLHERSTLTSTSSTDMEESAVLSDPETERYSSLTRRYRRVIGRNRTQTMRPFMRHRSANRTHCRVIVRQPVIDLSQMVLVPFDAGAWSGPVLKPRSALTPSEQQHVIEPESELTGEVTSKTDSHTITDLLSQNRRLFSKKSCSGTRNRCDSTPSYTTPIQAFTSESVMRESSNKGIVFHYDSDSAASHQSDSWTSGTHRSNQSTKKRTVMDKLFGLVKTGTQRRFTHPHVAESVTVPQIIKKPVNSPPQQPHATIVAVTKISEQKIKQRVTNLPSRVPLPVEDVPSKKGNQVFSKTLESKPSTDPVRLRLSEYCILNSRPSVTHQVYHLARQSQPSADVSSTNFSPLTGSPVKQSTLNAEMLTSSPGLDDLAVIHHNHHPLIYADLSFPTVTKSIQTSCSPQCNTDYQIEFNKSTVNRLYETDVSSCSTAYESVVEFLTATEGSISPKQKSGREVYEDAEALYRYLTDLKQPNTSEDEDQTTILTQRDPVETQTNKQANAPN